MKQPNMTRKRRLKSLSARRAWIEIRRASGAADINHVALRKESVDRNVEKINKKRLTFGRSPQGERG